MFNPRDYPPIDRAPDGSLLRMTPKQHREAVKLIRRRCCNCDHGNCILLDDGDEVVCPQTLTRSVCCAYFRHVLLKAPEAKSLELALFSTGALRYCAMCGKPYQARSKNAKYCGDCKVIAQWKQQAEYARRSRSRHRKVEL